MLFAFLLARVRSETSITACQYGGPGGSTITSMISQRGCTDHGDRTHAAQHTPNDRTSYFDRLVHKPQEFCIEAETRRRMHHAHSPKNILHGHAVILLPMSFTFCTGGGGAWTPPRLLRRPRRWRMWYRGRGARPWLRVPLAAWVGGLERGMPRRGSDGEEGARPTRPVVNHGGIR